MAKSKDPSVRIGEIVAEMSSITEFALGSLVSGSNYYTTKSGERRKAKPRHVFQSRGPRGKQRHRHVPEDLVPKVRKLVENGRRYERLAAEYERLVTDASLDALKKKAAAD